MNRKYFILFFMLLFLASYASAYSYGQIYTQNKPSYYGQYNFRYNSFSNPIPYANAYRGSGAANYVGGYGNHGWSPFLMPSTTYNYFAGKKTNYDSHIFIRNALDYTYYTHPELLAPRYMDNHQRQYRGLWPQRFDY